VYARASAATHCRTSDCSDSPPLLSGNRPNNAPSRSQRSPTIESDNGEPSHPARGRNGASRGSSVHHAVLRSIVERRVRQWGRRGRSVAPNVLCRFAVLFRLPCLKPRSRSAAEGATSSRLEREPSPAAPGRGGRLRTGESAGQQRHQATINVTCRSDGSERSFPTPDLDLIAG
jgi:hypothetical protein